MEPDKPDGKVRAGVAEKSHDEQDEVDRGAGRCRGSDGDGGNAERHKRDGLTTLSVERNGRYRLRGRLG